MKFRRAGVHGSLWLAAVDVGRGHIHSNHHRWKHYSLCNMNHHCTAVVVGDSVRHSDHNNHAEGVAGIVLKEKKQKELHV